MTVTVTAVINTRRLSHAVYLPSTMSSDHVKVSCLMDDRALRYIIKQNEQDSIDLNASVLRGMSWGQNKTLFQVADSNTSTALVSILVWSLITGNRSRPCFLYLSGYQHYNLFSLSTDRWTGRGPDRQIRRLGDKNTMGDYLERTGLRILMDNP